MKTIKDKIFAIILAVMAGALIYFAISDFADAPEEDSMYQEEF